MIVKARALIYKDSDSSIRIVHKAQIEIEDGKIVGLGRQTSLTGLEIVNLILPQFINAHIHVQDLFLRKYFQSMYIDDVVGAPFGIKYVLLKKVDEYIIRQSIEKTYEIMYRTGVGEAYVVLEYGLKNIKILEDVCSRYPINTIPFLEPEHFHIVRDYDSNYEIINEVKNIVDKGYNVELISPLNYTDYELKEIEKIVHSKGRLIMTHVSETQDTAEEGDLEIATKILKADILVHCIFANNYELLKDKLVVVTPRSNMKFIGRICNLKLLKNYCKKILVGTDNVGLVDPDMWYEVRTLLNININPIDIFNMVFLENLEVCNIAKFQIVSSELIYSDNLEKILYRIFMTGRCVGRIDGNLLKMFNT